MIHILEQGQINNFMFLHPVSCSKSNWRSATQNFSGIMKYSLKILLCYPNSSIFSSSKVHIPVNAVFRTLLTGPQLLGYFYLLGRFDLNVLGISNFENGIDGVRLVLLFTFFSSIMFAFFLILLINIIFQYVQIYILLHPPPLHSYLKTNFI